MVKGFQVFGPDPYTLAWARAAREVALEIAADPGQRAAHLRHGATWFVGVDALPNGPDGSLSGVPLEGAWRDRVAPPAQWHRAQLSIVYPGYPRRDPDESDTRHRYRVRRHAAHVDGLLPEGPDRRRFLREPHAFILGLPLNGTGAAPLMVWPGSQRTMGAAFRDRIGTADPESVDLTETYHAARRGIFDRIEPVPVRAAPGQAILLHRHLLHGVAPWYDDVAPAPEGRMIAYFRPQYASTDWLAP